MTVQIATADCGSSKATPYECAFVFGSIFFPKGVYTTLICDTQVF